jgi:hypothetical protein
MRSEVVVLFGPAQEFRISLEGVASIPMDQARRWLDQQFLALECEPLRASGKLLTADRVVCIAQAAGPARMADPAWAEAFAQAASAALGKATVRIDVQALAVTY